MKTDETKLIAIATRLLDRTSKGQAEWEETGDENVFQTSFEDASIWVGSPGSGTYSIRVLNQRGVTIAHLSSAQFEPGHSTLQELYEVARRRALKVDETIDGLLNRLG